MANVDLTNQPLPLSQHEQIIDCLSRYIEASDRMVGLMLANSSDTIAMVRLQIERSNARLMAIHLGYLWPDQQG